MIFNTNTRLAGAQGCSTIYMFRCMLWYIISASNIFIFCAAHRFSLQSTRGSDPGVKKARRPPPRHRACLVITNKINALRPLVDSHRLFFASLPYVFPKTEIQTVLTLIFRTVFEQRERSAVRLGSCWTHAERRRRGGGEVVAVYPKYRRLRYGHHPHPLYCPNVPDIYLRTAYRAAGTPSRSELRVPHFLFLSQFVLSFLFFISLAPFPAWY